MGILFLTDIDECLLRAMDGIQLCSNQMVCINTEGSFTCRCPSGTTLIDGVCSESKFIYWCNHLMMLICTSIVCAENYYRLRSTRCAACPSNSIRQLNQDDELCPCLGGYGRHQEDDINQPCRRKMQRNMH